MMKKNIRNRFLAVTAAAASSFLLLSGFDSALTVQDIQNNVRDAMSSMGGFSADVQAVADLSLDMAVGEQSQSLPVTGNASFTVQFIEEPFAMAVSGSAAADASAMGFAANQDLDVYMIAQDDGTGIVYVRMPQGGDDGWHAAAVTTEYMDQIIGNVKGMLSGDMSSVNAQMGSNIDLNALMEKYKGDMVLAPEAVNVNGTDCYEITQSFDGDTLFSLITDVAGAVPTAGMDASSLSAFQMFFSGIRLDTVTDVAVDTFKPVYAGMDLGGSDFSMLGQMVGSMMMSSAQGASQDQDGSQAQAPSISVTVNALNCAMNYADAPDEIIVPEEALAAPVEGPVSVPDLSGAMQAPQ